MHTKFGLILIWLKNNWKIAFTLFIDSLNILPFIWWHSYILLLLLNYIFMVVDWKFGEKNSAHRQTVCSSVVNVNVPFRNELNRREEKKRPEQFWTKKKKKHNTNNQIKIDNTIWCVHTKLMLDFCYCCHYCYCYTGYFNSTMEELILFAFVVVVARIVNWIKVISEDVHRSKIAHVLLSSIDGLSPIWNHWTLLFPLHFLYDCVSWSFINKCGRAAHMRFSQFI